MARRRATSGVEGVLNVDKPAGLTSHDVVARVRRMSGERRVGHAGTLDPMATGVLVVCLGRATRLAEYIADGPKRYRATVRLGVETDTWDADGQVVASADWRHLRLEDLQGLLARFRGRVRQVPPMYSALKREGEPLYRLARRGVEVEREARDVEIHALDLVAWDPPDLLLDVTCSKGTYVRSLAHDLGEAAGVGAHLAALRRLAVGAFTIEGATPLEVLEEQGAWRKHLLRPAAAVAHLPSLVVDGEGVARIAQGQSVSLEASGDGPLAALTSDGALVAILQPAGEPAQWRPDKVFAPPL